MEYNSNLIIEFKRKYSDIYQVEIGGTKIIFRALTFLEFDELSIAEDYTSSVDSEEEIVKTALLYPEFDELGTLGAGVVSSLAEEIIEESCFFDVKKSAAKLEEQRESISDIRNLMKAFVLAAMPVYKEEELDRQTFVQLSHKVALSEQILEMNFYSQRGVFSEEAKPPVLVLIDPEEEVAKKAGMDPIAEKLHQAFG